MTICYECKHCHCSNREYVNISRCMASPNRELPQEVDPVTGYETIQFMALRRTVDGEYEFKTSARYAECDDINDGNCKKFEPIPSRPKTPWYRRLFA
jgi:hypothetical protein